ncbi:zinc-binding dehydrogenase [Streptomyces sparsogenes]|uniref:zinc-binding dehydrogenase n=1 Tax=Streptomyces sparsogenes TaxID=67365 RepID=UPI0033CEAD86
MSPRTAAESSISGVVTYPMRRIGASGPSSRTATAGAAAGGVPVLERSGAAGPPLRELLRLTVAQQLRPLVGGEYPLTGAADAHRDLLGRRTTGKLVLRV